jgi:hypothetical protein
VAEEVERSLAEDGIRFVAEQYGPELVERVTAERVKRRRRFWRRFP